ncbi:hypothetical protein O181_023884 [Austropuccinia psidii MF-1]|uniref:Uncharacterized protein n=1 Tax=Austropuccinia psidii MF-1 TaxID=1389203 RepID=A0A9Q3CF91_9BASI|nr:hypothetical protein [Austropuccinia psidii MF-1]
MSETKRTDVGGTEGEDSVGSVSSELMNKYYARKITQGIRIMHFKPEISSRKWDHKPIMAPLKVHLGSNNNPGPTLPLWGGKFLDGPGPSQWAQAMWRDFGLWVILLVPWTPSILGPRGTQIAPTVHRPHTTAHRP